MRVLYKDLEFIIDPETDFIMLEGCYMNGGNCYNCHERILDECPCDYITMEEILEEGVKA